MSRSEALVDAEWVEAHAGDPGVVLVEVDEDTSAYDKGHIRNAIKIDWKKDLQDPVRRAARCICSSAGSGRRHRKARRPDPSRRFLTNEPLRSPRGRRVGGSTRR